MGNLLFKDIYYIMTKLLISKLEIKGRLILEAKKQLMPRLNHLEQQIRFLEI